MQRFVIFLVVGGGGFVVDAGITHLMLHWGYSPSISRIPAIPCAILFTWLANRRLTYQVESPKSRAELIRYTSAALVLSLFNYLAFIWIVGFGITPILALILATALQIVLSFNVYKSVVFRATGGQRGA